MSEYDIDHGVDPDATIAAAIDRGEIIGGVLDPQTMRIIPVGTPVTVFRNDADGYTLREFRFVRDGVQTEEAAALMADVDEGGQTRCWRLTDDARAAGYAETEVLYSGDGTLHHWDTDGAHATYGVSPEREGQQIHVDPGEAFMIVAKGVRDDAHRVGVRVLSLCTAFFQENFERVIAPPTSLTE